MQCRVGCPPALDFRCWRDGAESGPRERAMGMWDGRAEGSGMEDKERDGGRGLEIREEMGLWEGRMGKERDLGNEGGQRGGEEILHRGQKNDKG